MHDYANIQQTKTPLNLRELNIHHMYKLTFYSKNIEVICYSYNSRTASYVSIV